MDIVGYNHFYAFVGSLATIITLLFIHKNKIDKGVTKVSMKIFLSKQWDDFVYLSIIAQILVLVQEFIVGAYIEWQKIENGWDFYFDNEELIAFSVGIFGMFIFIKLFNMGQNKIKDH